MKQGARIIEPCPRAVSSELLCTGRKAVIEDRSLYPKFREGGLLIGNRVEMTYDGFDPRPRWIFQSPSGGGIANPEGHEEYGYDPNGNRTTLRKRTGAQP